MKRKRMTRKIKEQTMKNTLTILLIAGVLFYITPNLMAEESNNARLISALKSDNIGWRVDAARLLGEAADMNSVEPLIDVLKNDENSSARISAAVALYKIGDRSAMKALKTSAKHDPNKTVRTVSAGAYHELKKLDEQIAVN